MPVEKIMIIKSAPV